MVYVYALCDVYYDSFYIKGIKEVFESYKFNLDKFPNFKQGTFAVIIENKNKTIKIIIDSLDTNICNIETLDWCDIYAKVNYNFEVIPEKYSQKILPIGPSFGIKIWSFSKTIYNAFRNYNLLKFRNFNKREFFANYWRQYKRMTLESYKPEKSENNYIFFISSIWKKESQTNSNRACFINACKNKKSICFEGGFAPRNDGDNFGFDSLTVHKSISIKEYIFKIKKSALVFNTPAVTNCHGWKLGEFLAMGKVILSTKHFNSFPSKLVSNHHLIIVENIENIENDINLIINSIDLKEKLETNSRAYFEDYLAPKRVIELLLESKILNKK